MLPKVGDYVLVNDIDENRKVDDVAVYSTGWVEGMHQFIGKIAVVEEVQSANYCKLHYQSTECTSTVRLRMSNFSAKMSGKTTRENWWFCVHHLTHLPDFVDLD